MCAACGIVFPQQAKLHPDEIGFCTGWGKASMLEDSRDYEILPVALRIGFDLTGKFGCIEREDAVSLLVEPFVNAVASPEPGFETGCGFLLRYAYPVSGKTSLYAEGGIGGIYLSQDTRQTTRVNFMPECGLGMRFFPGGKRCVDIGYRFRHCSNAGFAKPNSGLDMHLVMLGLSRFY